MTQIKEAYFYGPQSEYIMSGSDNGQLFVWEKKTGDIVCKLRGDKHVVNCIAPNPHDATLAVSGIDHDIKVLAPTAVQPWSSDKSDKATTTGERGVSESEEGDEDEDDEWNPFADGIPRPLLLLYLARLGVDISDVSEL
jgi:WD40 repeat protein